MLIQCYSLTVVSCVRLTSLVEFATTTNSTCKLFPPSFPKIKEGHLFP